MNMMECAAGKGNIIGIMCGVFMVCCGVNFESITTTAAPPPPMNLNDLSQLLSQIVQFAQVQNNPLFTQPSVSTLPASNLPSSSIYPNSISNIFFPVNNVPTIPFMPQTSIPYSPTISAVPGDECGVVQVLRSPKIVGGVSASYGEFPWQTLIIINGDPRCGGALLAKEWVATAAHCVNGVADSSIILRLGDYNTHDLNPLYPRVDRTVIQRIVHPQFNNPKNYANDIVLLRLNQPVMYQINIKPICLPPYQSYTGYTGTISGWGKPRYGARKDDVPAILQKASLPVLSNGECQSMYSYMRTAEIISDYWLCAGYKEGGTDACQGDSGGPLATLINGVWCLIGLVSWGYGCAFPNYPGVYTNITMFVPWIQSQIQMATSLNTVSFG